MATHRFAIEGKEYEVQVGARSGSSVQVTVNGEPYQVELRQGGAATSLPSPAPAATAAPSPMTAAPAPAPAAGAGGGEVRAPIPGVVLSVSVEAGQTVQAGAQLLVLEAMKMENEIVAEVGGVVASVHVKPQQDVRQGDLMVKITPG